MAPLRLAVFGLLLIGCSSAQKDKDQQSRPRWDNLSQVVTAYNETLRWGVPMQALNWVATESQAGFLESLAPMKGNRVLEVDIEAIKPFEQREAEVFVRFTWTPPDSISTQSTVIRQQWRPRGKMWEIYAAHPTEDRPSIFTFTQGDE